MRPQLSRADLLECLAAHDSVHWEQLVEALGFAPKPVALAHHQETPAGIPVVNPIPPSPELVQSKPAPAIRFLRPLSCRRLVPEGIDEPDWFKQAQSFIDENDPAISAPTDATSPTTPPLMPWPRLWPFVQWALGALLNSHRLDLPQTIDRLAKGEWLKRLPRARRFGWATEGLLLIDYAEPLVPFWGDFHTLKQRLPALRGAAGLNIIAFPDGDPLGRVWQARDEDDWQTLARFNAPKPGTPLLVLSDLGCNDREPHRRQRWQRFGEKLKRAGCRPVALMPCPPRRWDGALARLFDLACWDRAARLPRQHKAAYAAASKERTDKRDDAETLLALLSPAIRVEPGLLRAARLLLPAGQADVGTEASAWNHADVQQTLTAFFYQPAAQSRYRQRFCSSFELKPQQAIARRIADQHGPLSPFIVLEEMLVLLELIGEASLKAALSDAQLARLAAAQALLQRLAKTCAGQTPLAEASKAWVGRFGERDQPLELWAKQGALETAWVLTYRQDLLEGRIEKLPPGLSLRRVAWVLAGQGGVSVWQLSQVGGMLHATLNAVHRSGISLAPLEAIAPYINLTPISEAQALGLRGFFYPETVGEALPAATLLSLIHPLQFDQATPPSSRPYGLAQPMPLPAADIFRLSTDHTDWLFDAITQPTWADGISRDRNGLFVEVQAGPERLKLYWQAHEAQDIAGLRLSGTWGGFEALGRDQFGLWAEVALYQWEDGSADDAVDSPLGGHFTRTAQRFRRILPGRFWMGSPPSEPERESFGVDETQHEVTLTQGYWLAETACTQAFWQMLMGNNPNHFDDNPQNPVESVSWHDAQALINTLNERIPSLRARLPSEAEWEYACRAGTTTPFSFGDNITPEQVNYYGNYPYAGGKKGQYRRATVPVKNLPPNPWGLYEMHGNVWEWCQDGLTDFTVDPQSNPVGPLDSAYRVLRGGSWFNFGRRCRSAYRHWDGPDSRNYDFGFRLALGPTGQPVKPEAPGPTAATERGGRAGGETAEVSAAGPEQASWLDRFKSNLKTKRRKLDK